MITDTKLCCVGTCGRPHFGLGLCNGHYDRCYRTGELLPEVPLGAMKSYDSFYWLVDRLEKPFGSDCVTWPFSTDVQEYGITWCPRSGKQRVGHLVLESTGRLRPATKNCCRYLCGQIRCINPNHLAWGPPGPLSKHLKLVP